MADRPFSLRAASIRLFRNVVHPTLLLVAVLASLAACAPEPRSVLLITIDTLRADHLGLYGYPRETSPTIDALGEGGIVFEHAIVQWPVTTPSMVSMFSATYPRANGIHSVAMRQWVPGDLVMLPEVFQEQGFRTVGVAANSVLGVESNFPQGLDTFREVWQDDQWVGPSRKSAENVTDIAIQYLDGLAESGERFLLWVHYVDPHSAYRPPEGYAERFFGDEYFRSQTLQVNKDGVPWKGVAEKDWRRAAQEDDLGRYIARYDGEIRYLDDHLARLLGRLETLGVDGETLVVVTSDHGESLGEHDYYFNHGHLAYEEQVRVPLVLRWPGGRYGGRRIKAPVELRGLGPTLLDALGLERRSLSPAPSWLPAIRGDEASLPATVFTTAGTVQTGRIDRNTLAVRRDSFKLILPRSSWTHEIAGGRKVELYDLSADPDEVNDLAPARPAQVRALRDDVAAWFNAIEMRRPERPAEAPALREKTKRALRDLGYLD